MAIPIRYNTGYNIGVGGAVVRRGQLLLVRRASRHGRGNWQLPGGFIEPDETIEQAVVREVQEEAGVTAEVEVPDAHGEVLGVAHGDQPTRDLDWQVELRARSEVSRVHVPARAPRRHERRRPRRPGAPPGPRSAR